jgi:hypothetical protein
MDATTPTESSQPDSFRHSPARTRQNCDDDGLDFLHAPSFQSLPVHSSSRFSASRPLSSTSFITTNGNSLPVSNADSRWTDSRMQPQSLPRLQGQYPDSMNNVGTRPVRQLLFEEARMRSPRAAPLIWRAMYELWRLSWYHINDTGDHDTRVFPTLIRLGAWLQAIRTSYDPSQEQQHHHQHLYPRPTTPQPQVPVSMRELVQLASALVSPMNVATTRWSPSLCQPLYAIHPVMGEQIQQYLHETVQQQSLRPGIPTSADQLRALAVTPPMPATVHLSPYLTTYHTAWAQQHLYSTVDPVPPPAPPSGAVDLQDAATVPSSPEISPRRKRKRVAESPPPEPSDTPIPRPLPTKESA